MTTLATVAAGTGAITDINDNFIAASPAAVYGRRAAATSGLTWGYYGGIAFGATVANGTVSLTASNTNYIVASRSTGAVSVATSTTNWNNATDYFRLYQVVAGASAVTSYTDHRDFTGGGGGSGGSADLVSYDNSTSGLSATNVQDALDEVAAVIVSAATQTIAIACSDETTALSAGASKVTFHMPYDFTLTEVIAGLTTAQASGSIFTVDINAAGTSILSTKLTIDNTEETSITAATPAVISTSALTKGQKMTIDIDQIGNGSATGLKVYFVGVPT